MKKQSQLNKDLETIKDRVRHMEYKEGRRGFYHLDGGWFK